VVRQEPAKLPFPSSNLGTTFMIYLVATPIGNLGDITLRALEVLKRCDYILCEDTRHASILLKHYQIKKPLKSYHKFSEGKSESRILDDLRDGKEIALLSDAGTPGICDPGAALVKRCREEGLAVTALPGACAPIVALTLSGMGMEQFQFVGFLPKKLGELKERLRAMTTYAGTSICFETPHRIEKTVAHLVEIAPHHRIGIVREMTKVFEECLLMTPADLLAHIKQKPLRGEMVLLIEGKPEVLNSDLDPVEQVHHLQSTQGLTKTEAIKEVAKLRGIDRRTLYKQVIDSTL
jgi:16S rRNA (cytidine1402-2'-O)-methyltransferase